MNRPRGKLRELVLGSCPRCKSTNLVKLGIWNKKDDFWGEQRYRCNDCRRLFPASSLCKILSFVFRLDSHDCFWEAYLPGYLFVPVMTGINCHKDKWFWNSYDIGEFNSRNELVRHYLAIRDNLEEHIK